MAGSDKDEAPMLSSSMSITMEPHETGNNRVGSNGPLRSPRRPPSVQGDMNRYDKIVLICCLVAIFLDPLFFFLISVHQDNKCLIINWPMTDTFVVFRSLTDFVYLLNILLKFRRAHESRVDHPTRAARYNLNDFVDLFLVLPLPQIMILWVLSKSLGSSGANYAKNLILLAVLIQYIPRLFRFLPLLVGQSPNGIIFETAWANFFINLFTFMLSGHVIGSWWYLLGLQRVERCLHEACDNSGFEHTKCLRFIDSGKGNPGNGFDLNWTKNENASACFSGDSFEYGIYKQAVNLTSQDITKRYIYSLFWGFQQISTLAGNQQPSYFVWEVLFTMLIIGLGLLLFAFLIGNMQNFLQALGQRYSQRRLEFSVRQRDVEHWMRHRSLPQELQGRVLEAERYNWDATKGVNEGMLIEKLPEDIQRDIRSHLFKSFKKVPLFASVDQHILDDIYERLKRTIYIEGSKILYPGGVVDKMVFIMHGELVSIGDDRTVTPLYEGSVCGEELLPWLHKRALESKDGKKMKVTGKRLLSNRKVICTSNVEAFSLREGDLEELTDLFGSLKNT